MYPGIEKGANQGLFDHVRSILDKRELTVHGLSKLSERAFGRSSRYFISHNFYYDLRVGTVCPNIYQLFALSHFSNYRLVDWLRVFGFQLDEIPRLQTLLHRPRTVILDSTNYDKEAWVSWFQARATPLEPHKIIPIVRIVAKADARRVRSIERWNKRAFLYVKIGQEDALAFPDLVPGSVLRVDPRNTTVSERSSMGRSPHPLYLVEHDKGLTCCRLNFIDAERVGLISDHLPFANLEFHLDKEIRILGVADLEIHPLNGVPQARVSAELAKEWTHVPIRLDNDNRALSDFIRLARLRNGLRFREASRISREIAEGLGDTRYFMTPRSLFSYERLGTPPRLIHKIISLCIIYGIVFWDFLSSAGMNLEQLGQEPIPEDLLPRVPPGKFRHLPRENDDPPQQSIFPEALFEEIPLFLRSSLSGVIGLPSFSIRDVFWTGGSQKLFHPLLAGSYFVIVNRRVKRPVQSLLNKPWEGPLCMILMRNGDYVCSPCVVKDGELILHPHPDSSVPPMTLRNREEAEIIGRVVAIVRGL
jgi:hypothetical protein